MKILAIDDQQLILLSLEKRLQELGYEVKTADSGKDGLALVKDFQPNLVIVDINMPDISGLDVVQEIRTSSAERIPIMVMSGNTDENVITKGFELDIDDYMKKPVSLNEIVARVKRIIGTPETTVEKSKKASQVIQEYCVGVVIPCYNEAERLSGKDFLDFSFENLGYNLCFVNDGSTDNTLEVLREIQKGNEDHITVYDCAKNGGKAEAVRQGMLHMAKDPQYNYIGFLDADLSTDFRDFDDLVKTLGNSDYKIVNGSRMARMGADIEKESARAIISKTINLMIRTILRMPFNDTQCGAKVMDKDIVKVAFEKPFLTKWLFDVEMFKRISNHYGRKKALEIICEQPLKRWVHADGSKLSFKDSAKIGIQLLQIAVYYRKKSTGSTKETVASNTSNVVEAV